MKNVHRSHQHFGQSHTVRPRSSNKFGFQGLIHLSAEALQITPSPVSPWFGWFNKSAIIRSLHSTKLISPTATISLSRLPQIISTTECQIQIWNSRGDAPSMNPTQFIGSWQNLCLGSRTKTHQVAVSCFIDQWRRGFRVRGRMWSLGYIRISKEWIMIP